MNGYDFSTLRAMVVDQSQPMRELFTNMLRGAGFKAVATVLDPVAVPEAIAHDPVDIIFIDRDLSPMDGNELVRRIRNELKEPANMTSVVMVAAYESRVQVLATRDAGATEIVARPFSAKPLLRAVGNIIDHPRPFIRTKNFFGPCRRRRSSFDYGGPERRKEAEKAAA